LIGGTSRRFGEGMTDGTGQPILVVGDERERRLIGWILA
jgi:hypothetical protein